MIGIEDANTTILENTVQHVPQDSRVARRSWLFSTRWVQATGFSRFDFICQAGVFRRPYSRYRLARTFYALRHRVSDGLPAARGIQYGISVAEFHNASRPAPKLKEPFLLERPRVFREIDRPPIAAHLRPN